MSGSNIGLASASRVGVEKEAEALQEARNEIVKPAGYAEIPEKNSDAHHDHAFSLETCINTQKHVCIHLLRLGILDKYASMVCYSACVCIINYDSITSNPRHTVRCESN